MMRRGRYLATVLVLGIMILYILSNTGNKKYLSIHGKRFNNPTQTSNQIQYPQKPVFAIGIFSRETSLDLRKSTRETWLSQIHTTPFDIKYKFILDRPTKETENERMIYGDIIYTNMSAELSGYANCFSTRILKWFHYAAVNFPTAELIGKMDDDVYLCVPRNFERIFNVRTKRLYYGWKHGGNDNKIGKLTRVDEMFVVVGKELVDRITKRKYCGCFLNESLSADCNQRNSKSELISHRYADIALSLWLSSYDDVDRVSDNKYIRHYSYEFYDRMTNFKYAVPEFCLKNNVLFHKSSNFIKYKLHHYNMLFRAGNQISSKSTISKNMLRDVPFIPSFYTKGKPFKPQDVFCKYWVVIRAPKTFSNQLLSLITSFASMNWCVIVIGDQYSDTIKKFQKGIGNNNKTVFLRPEDHEVYFSPLSDALFWDHVGRRNIGYAYAMHHGAKFIFDYYHDDKMVSCFKDILPNIKTNLTTNRYMVTKCGGIIWPCTTFTFIALPISVSHEYAHMYRMAIIHAIQMTKINNENGLYNQSLSLNITSALTEIPEILKQHNIEDIYLHLYRRGLVEYYEVLFIKIWKMSIPQNGACP